MQMPRQSGAGYFAEVQSDVESFGFQFRFEQPTPMRKLLHQIDVFVSIELVQSGLMPPRGHEQMAVVVGVQVQYDE